MIFYVLPLRGVRESRDFSRVEVSISVLKFLLDSFQADFINMRVQDS